MVVSKGVMLPCAREPALSPTGDSAGFFVAFRVPEHTANSLHDTSTITRVCNP